MYICISIACSKEDEVLFGQYSTIIDTNEVKSLYKSNLNHIYYLTGVVQHIKRQVRGFDGEKGILETVNDRLKMTPSQMMKKEIEKNTLFLSGTLDKL